MKRKSIFFMLISVVIVVAALAVALTACGEKKDGSICSHSQKTYVGEVTPATCTTQGVAKYKCGVCGEEVEVKTDIVPTAHVWDEAHEIREEHCDAPGTLTHTCLNCGKTETVTISSYGHRYVRSEVIPITCEQQAEYYYECEICHDHYTEYIPPKGHTAGEWQAADNGAPTCTQIGTEVKKCVDCNKVVETRRQNAYGHVPMTPVETKKATCEEHGELTTFCERCGEVIEKKNTPFADHIRVPIGKYIEPTCTSLGKSAGEMCSVCLTVFERQEDIPMRDHNYERGVCVDCEAEKECRATFMAAGEQVGRPIFFTVSTADTVKQQEPSVPYKPGRRNGRWEDYTPLYDDIVINAIYELIGYHIDYKLECEDYDGGSSVKNKNATSYTAEEVVTLKDLELPGYRFEGWFDESGQKVEVIDPTVPGFVFKNITLTAKWEYANYSIDYVDIDGFDSASYKKTYTKDSPTFDLPTLSKNGYIFKGWRNGDEQDVLTKIVVGSYGDLTLSPVFETIVYDITYVDDHGAENPNPKTYTVETATIVLKALEKAGYKFTGWTSNGVKKDSIAFGSYGELTLTATWEREEYTITYQNIDEKYTRDFPQSYNVESEAIELPSVSIPGCEFDGWLLDGAKVTHIRAGSHGNVVLVAKFIPYKYTVKLDANGGVLHNSTQEVSYDERYTLEVPVRVGYEFLGWFAGRDGGAKQLTDANGESLDPFKWTDIVTFSAQWKIRTYTVTFATGSGGSRVEDKKFEYNSPFVPPAEPTRSNYFFAGWYDGDVEYTTSTLITSDVTLTAKWVDSIAISDITGLKAIASAPDKNYHLTNDIDLRGDVWTPIPEFSGTLNGRGFRIYNFSLSSTEPGENFGFFAVNNGTLKDLTIANFTINVSLDAGNINMGGFVGKNGANGVIQNIISKSDAQTTTMVFNCIQNGGSPQTCAGGLVGRNEGKVLFCTQEMDIKYTVGDTDRKETRTYQSAHLGNLIGYNAGEIANCSVEGPMEVNARTQHSEWGGYQGDILYNLALYVGGLVGYNAANASLKESNATTYIKGSYTEVTQYSSRIGVAVGTNMGLVRNCFAMGEMSGNYYNFIGALVGHNGAGGRVESSYSFAEVNATYAPTIGGLVGCNDSVIQNCYATGDVKCAANSDIGGLVGHNTSTGSVFKCFTMNDVTVPGGNAGYVIGKNDGVLQNSYYSQSNVIMIGTQYVEQGTDYSKAIRIARNKIWTEEFLYGTLYWDNEGWAILTDANPRLDWELAVGHNFTIKTEDPTCEEEGFTIYSCNDCGIIFVKDYIPALGHQYHTESIVPAGCTTEGYTLKECDVCYTQIHDDIRPATGHPLDRSTVSDEQSHRATCTAPGTIVYHCDACGNNYSVEEKALGHTISGDSKDHRDATCSVPGKDTYACGTCGQDFDVEIPCIPHHLVDVSYQAPTCGIVYTDGEIDLGKSKPVDGHYAGQRCDKCDFIAYGCGVIPAHTFVHSSYTTEPTCTHAGVETLKCSQCGFEKTGVEVPMIAHTDKDGNFECDVCKNTTFSELQLSQFVHIKEASDFELIRKEPYNFYWLDSDIDFGGENWKPIGTKEQPFNGIFFGAGHTINGVNFEARDNSDVNVLGLFAYNSGKIINLKLGAYTLTTYNADVVFGGIVAYNNYNGEVRDCSLVGEKGNCKIEATVELIVTDYSAHELSMSGSTIGGLVGVNEGLIDNCKLNNNIEATFKNICEIRSEEVLSSLVSLIKNTSAVTEQRVTYGGVVGENKHIVSNCSSLGVISADVNLTATLTYMRGKAYANTYFYAGAIVGRNGGDITGCMVSSRMRHNLLNRDVTENAPSFLNGLLYEMGYSYHNSAPIYGVDGLSGYNDEGSTFDCKVISN